MEFLCTNRAAAIGWGWRPGQDYYDKQAYKCTEPIPLHGVCTDRSKLELFVHHGEVRFHKS